MGMAGPAIQAIGFAWEGVHLFTAHVEQGATARHLAFEPAVLVIVVGFLVSVVCVPAALELARARFEDLELPFLGLEGETADQRAMDGWR